MKPRYIMLTIDTIAELIKDYVGEDEIPADAMPTMLMVRPTEQGKLALELVSDHWNPAHLEPLSVNFRVKRFSSIV